MTRNLTVRLDEATIHKARILANRRSTSISQLLTKEIERAVDQDASYQRNLHTALHQLDTSFHLGKSSLPTRQSLHERS